MAEARLDTGHWLQSVLARPRFELFPAPDVVALAETVPLEIPLTLACLPRTGVDRVVDVAEDLARRGHQVIPHVPARAIRSAHELAEAVGRLKAAAITDVFVVGGDRSEAAGPYPDAASLLEQMCADGDAFDRVGVACYPEHHPFLDDRRLTESLRAKQAYASYMVSQICFDGAQIARWLRRMRAAGIELPLYVGVPGVVDLAYLLRIALRVGVGNSLRFLRKNSGMLRMIRGGRSFRPDRLLWDLNRALAAEDQQVAGIHLNTFNRVGATERWRLEHASGAGR